MIGSFSNCAPACFSCDKLDRSVRCAFDANAPKAWGQPGDLNRFFARIVRSYENITVLSGPADQIKALNIATSDIKDGPWILTLDDFLSEEECDHLIAMGEQLGYERSKGRLGGEDVEVNQRTSSNTWCRDACYDHPVTLNISERVQALTAPIPEANGERWQLLKYTKGQHYKVHSDYIAHHLEREQGVRILTVFFYLNTAQGGGTRFPAPDLTVQPVKGRAVLWPSVLDENPDAIDPRTEHEALPAVTAKYAANVWIHQRDFKSPYERNCD